MVYLARRSCLDHQSGTGTQPLTYQVLVNSGQGKQRGNSHMTRIYSAIRDDKDAVTRTYGVFCLRAKAGKPGFNCLFPPSHRIGDVNFVRLELASSVVIDMADRIHLVE